MIFGWLSVPSTTLEGALSLPSCSSASCHQNHLPPTCTVLSADLPGKELAPASHLLSKAAQCCQLFEKLLRTLSRQVSSSSDLFRDSLPTVLCLQEQTCLLEAQREARTTRKDVRESHWPF